MEEGLGLRHQEPGRRALQAGASEARAGDLAALGGLWRRGATARRRICQK